MQLSVVSCQLSVNAASKRVILVGMIMFGRTQAETNQAEDGISRYRTGWDAGATAKRPNSAAGTLASAASTRPRVNREDANWDSSASSRTVNITD